MRRGLTSSALPPCGAACVAVAAWLLAGCAATSIAVKPPPLQTVPTSAPASGAAAPLPKAVTLRIVETSMQQVIEGFGATVNEGFDLGTGEDEMGVLRPRVIDAVFKEVGI